MDEIKLLIPLPSKMERDKRRKIWFLDSVKLVSKNDWQLIFKDKRYRNVQYYLEREQNRWVPYKDIANGKGRRKSSRRLSHWHYEMLCMCAFPEWSPDD